MPAMQMFLQKYAGEKTTFSLPDAGIIRIVQTVPQSPFWHKIPQHPSALDSQPQG